MNIKIRRKLEMLKKLLRFCERYPIAALLLRAIAAKSEIATAVSDIESGASAQVGGRANSAGGVNLREELAQEIRKLLRVLGRIAKTLDAEIPGLRVKFLLPRTRSYPALLALAQTSIATVEMHEIAFRELGMGPTFLAELRARVADFRDATERKISGKLEQVGGTSAMFHHAARGLAAAQALDACMQSHYRNDPTMLDIWKHARHIERSSASAASSEADKSFPVSELGEISPENRLPTLETPECSVNGASRPWERLAPLP